MAKKDLVPIYSDRKSIIVAKTQSPPQTLCLMWGTLILGAYLINCVYYK